MSNPRPILRLPPPPPCVLHVKFYKLRLVVSLSLEAEFPQGAFPSQRSLKSF